MVTRLDTLGKFGSLKIDLLLKPGIHIVFKKWISLNFDQFKFSLLARKRDYKSIQFINCAAKVYARDIKIISLWLLL